MYFKLAINNVRKSFKDYSVYFLTLTLAVCIFYSFNSIESQNALIELRSSNSQSISNLVKIISVISVFVSIILGSLILYASNFLIKKRKKELGIYMILGMGKRKISKILLTETLIVGILSLASGLVLGFGVSQGLSMFTLKLFDLSSNDYQFSISVFAIFKTIIYFAVMFLLVMFFNVGIVSKYKVIELLTANKKNEEIRIKNPIVYFLIFIISIAMLAVSYKWVIETGLIISDNRFSYSIVMGIFGTLLFFFSLSGFFIYVLEKNKNIYLRGLNIFVIKQMNNKIKTNFLSMSLICLMLFLTIGILSTGISLKSNMDKSVEMRTPFDASVHVLNKDISYNIEELLNRYNFNITRDEEYISYDIYETDLIIKDFLGNQENIFNNTKIDFIKKSDYNKIMRFKKEEVVEIKSDEILILSSNNQLIRAIEQRINENNQVVFNEKVYTVKNDEVISKNLENDIIFTNFLTVVIEDSFLDNHKITKSVLNVNYLSENREELNKKYNELQRNVFENTDKEKDFLNIVGITKDGAYQNSKGLTTIILFVGMYIGIIFLITSMAVLAIQQLSEASDSIDRYTALRKIGASEKMIEKTIFIQTFIYFTLPIVLAFSHSIVGIKVVDSFLSAFQESDIQFSALSTAAIFLVVYGGYFYLTFTGYKNVVQNRDFSG